MTSTAIAIAALILAPILGLVTWGWRYMAQVDEELRGFNGFEGLHFDV